jgi:hypothetical protein
MVLQPSIDANHWTLGAISSMEHERSEKMTITLWLFNIAMENGPFIDGLPGFTY